MYWPPKVRLKREIQEGSGSDNREHGTSSIKMHAKLNLLNTTGQTARLMSVYNPCMKPLSFIFFLHCLLCSLCHWSNEALVVSYLIYWDSLTSLCCPQQCLGHQSHINILLITLESSDWLWSWFSLPSLPLSSSMIWRRQWQPTLVLLPGKSHGWKSIVGCSLWGC